MRRHLIVFICLFFITGCAAMHRAERQRAIATLEIGMSKADVLARMGKTKFGYFISQDGYEAGIYPLEIFKDRLGYLDVIKWTGVCFKNDVLVGWNDKIWSNKDGGSGVHRPDAALKQACSNVIASKKQTDSYYFSFRGVLMGLEYYKQASACMEGDVGPCYKQYGGGYVMYDLPDIGFQNSPNFKVDKDGNVIEMYSFSISQPDAEYLATLFESKYGSPHVKKSSIVQNGFGAKFDKYEYEWRINNSIIKICNRFGSVSKGSFSVRLIDSEVERKSEFIQQLHKNIENL